MKKIIALFLCVLLGMTGAMAADGYSSIELTDTISILLEVPEGYNVMKMRQDSVLYAGIYTVQEGKAQYNLSIAYSDLAPLITIDLMTEENIEQAKQIIGLDFANPVYTVEATAHGTKFLVINENGAEEDYVQMVTNYEGYFIQMYINAAEGENVSDEDIAAALAILSSLTFKAE